MFRERDTTCDVTFTSLIIDTTTFIFLCLSKVAHVFCTIRNGHGLNVSYTQYKMFTFLKISCKKNKQIYKPS